MNSPSQNVFPSGVRHRSQSGGKASAAGMQTSVASHGDFGLFFFSYAREKSPWSESKSQGSRTKRMKEVL